MSTIEDDRKLLLYAAKAAGIKLAQPHDHDDRLRNVTNMAPEGNLLSATVWNPLIDDGDALRLAVKLGYPHMIGTWMGCYLQKGE